MSENTTLIACNGKLTRAELANVPTPSATTTHVPIPHVAVVEGLVDTLSRRRIGVVARVRGLEIWHGNAWRHRPRIEL